MALAAPEGLASPHAIRRCSDPAGAPVTFALSIVIPVYNAGATIEGLCEELVRELGPLYALQIVLVNDGSTDGSEAACRRIHGRHPEIVDTVTLSRNFGEHRAVMAGLHHAEGEACVIMDDDFQNPPSEVRKLVEELRRGHDVVYARYDEKRHSPFRNFGSRLHNRMATRVLGKPRELYLSSFKALSGFVAKEVCRYTGPDPYVDGIIWRITRNAVAVTVRHEPRREGSSGYTLTKLVRLWASMFVGYSLFPLRVLAVFGLAIALVGAFYGVSAFAAWVSPAADDPDAYEKLNATMWFFRGMTLFTLCVIGEYVGRIYLLLGCDPQFVVRHMTKRHPRNAAEHVHPPVRETARSRSREPAPFP